MTTDSKDYIMAIQSLVAFARSINFNFQTGNFDVLMNDWINNSKRQHEEILKRKDSVIGIIKAIIK